MILQELHKIQHDRSYLPREELIALVERMNAGKTEHRDKMKLYQLHQIATFFPHFRLEPPPAADVRVCRDMACFMQGSPQCRAKLDALAGEIGGGKVKVEGVSCLGQCDRPPALLINDRVYFGKNEEELRELVLMAARGERLPPQRADSEPLDWKIDPYNGQPCYEFVKQFVELWRNSSESDPAKRRKRAGNRMLANMRVAKLRGMGGAGFPTFRKWITVRKCRDDDKYTICNGDESEPGTFKDRELLRRAPHLLIEGITLAGLVTGATQGWIFIRHEYQEEIAAVRKAIAEARALHASGSSLFNSELCHELDVFVSPGGYICGEESALLEAMEDRRAEPRNRPPLIVFEGYRGKPTVINNVETYCWVPAILKHGGGWYRDQGTNGGKGLRFVSISGDVARPGVYEVPFGQTVQELIYDSAGGMVDGQTLKAVAMSGPSGGFLPAKCSLAKLPKGLVSGLRLRNVVASDTPDAAIFDLLDLPLDSDVLKPGGLMLGAAFVVYGEGRNMAEQALNCIEFFRNESCGKCVPCRIGSQKLVQMLQAAVDRRGTVDLQLIRELLSAIGDASICGLGQSVPNPVLSVLEYFRDDWDKFFQQA